MRIPRIPTKGYGGTWTIVMLILIYAYAGRPVEQWMPAESELVALSGKAIFRHLPGTKSSISQNYLEVEGLRLSCDFSSLGARGGCSYASGLIDPNHSVHATYFWMPTRWGFSERMLHSLTQNNQLVISPQRTFEDRILNYKIGWDVYYQLLTAGALLAAILWFIERLNAKRKIPKVPESISF